MINVLLPLPVEPIIAIVSPFDTLNEISSKTYSSESGYLKETFLNSIVPISDDLVSFPSLILVLVCNTSLILSADIDALGYIINIIANIKNDIITCIA